MKPIGVGREPYMYVLALVLMSGCVTTEASLWQAATRGDLGRVTALLAQGHSAQAADERGVTPLFLAAQQGHRQVVALLLNHGASAIQPRHDGVTPLVVAIQGGHTEIVSLMLASGVDVNARTSQIAGATLLHVAAHRGDQEIVALLLKQGGNKFARMTSGERPVDLARQQGHTALIPLLEP